MKKNLFFAIMLSMDILKTFEIFLAAPLSIIRKRRIKIVHVETNIFNQKLPSSISFDENEIQLAVYNNKKVYSLLKTVLYKKKLKDKLNNDENNKSKVYNERAVALRVS